MALKKSVNTDYGVEATYWNIGSYQEDFKNKTADITMHGYATEKARKEEKQPMAAWQYRFTGESYVPDRNRDEIYKTLKTLKQWDKAQDA